MRRDGSLGGCTVGACSRDAAYASTGECTKHYKRRMAKRPRQWCSQCHLRRATYVAEGLCQACRQKRIAGYGSEVCKEESCTKPLYAKAPLRGWCRQHWEAELRSTAQTRYKPPRKPVVAFQVSKYQQLLERAREGFLADNHYMYDVAKAVGKVKHQ